MLQTVNGFSSVNSNISINDTTVFVYNFTVENAHTYFVGNGEVLTHNGCNKIADIIDDLPDAPTKKAFTNALKQNQSLVEAFSNGTVRIEDWSFLVNARGLNSEIANDLMTLKKVKALRNKQSFMTAIGGDQGLSQIVSANKRARCVSCGTSGASHMKNMDAYLDDVDYFASNFNNING